MTRESVPLGDSAPCGGRSQPGQMLQQAGAPTRPSTRAGPDPDTPTDLSFCACNTSEGLDGSPTGDASIRPRLGRGCCGGQAAGRKPPRQLAVSRPGAGCPTQLGLPCLCCTPACSRVADGTVVEAGVVAVVGAELGVAVRFGADSPILEASRSPAAGPDALSGCRGVCDHVGVSRWASVSGGIVAVRDGDVVRACR